MLIREITDLRVQALDAQIADLRERKKRIAADKARQRASKATQRAQCLSGNFLNRMNRL